MCKLSFTFSGPLSELLTAASALKVVLLRPAPIMPLSCTFLRAQDSEKRSFLIIESSMDVMN